jgi:hypothetical protein
MSSVMLELTQPSARWIEALAVAMTRPPGVPERRAHEREPGRPEGVAGRPRRIADDLAWLRQAMDEPEANGLRELRGTAAVSAWEPVEEAEEEVAQRLMRLRDRGVLGAGGFLLHEPTLA